MKLVLSIVVLVLVIFTLTGCKDDPTKVAKSFLSAIENQDFDKAMEFSTEHTQGELSGIKNWVGRLTEEDQKNLKKEKYRVEGFTLDGDKALVSYGEVSPKMTSSGKRMSMIKQNGIWKVDTYEIKYRFEDDILWLEFD